MNETVKSYRKTMGRIGAVLLLFLLIFYGIDIAANLGIGVLNFFVGSETVELVGMLVLSATYFASFALPAWFYHLGANGERCEPVRFTPRLPRSSLLIIFAGVACIQSMSVINGIAVDLFGIAETEGIFNNPNEFSKDYSIVLQFIYIAMVPAFCEELLFRGVVLSNLMPYGKARAIVISSVLFGLMHGNIKQFLYASVAGIIIGVAYVLTESIWCSILLHFINNTFSVFQTAVVDRFSEEIAFVIFIAYKCVLILVGIICTFLLVSRSRKDQKNMGLEAITFSSEISSRESAKGFLVPTVLAFLLISVFMAVYELMI